MQTSGLDSSSAYKLIQNLVELARRSGKTVIFSIHQPRSNIYSLFDEVVLLAHGRLVYGGPREHALNFLADNGYKCDENYNPADFLIDTVTLTPKEDVLRLAEQFPSFEKKMIEGNRGSVRLMSINEDDDDFGFSKTSEKGYVSSGIETYEIVDKVGEKEGLIYKEESLEKSSEDIGEHANPFILQFYYISKRTLKYILRNPYLLRFQYVMVVVVALFLGGLFWKLKNDISGVQDRIGCLFFLVALLSFGSLTSIDIFFAERALYLREKANG